MIQAKKAELLKALQQTAAALDKNPIVPLLENFLIRPVKDCLIITASNSQTEAITTVAAVCEPGEPIAAPAIFMDTVAKLPGDTVKIKPEDNSITITGQKGHYKIATENPDGYPRLEVSASPTMHKCADIKAALAFCLPFTSKDTGRAAMCAIALYLDGKKPAAVATDAHRLTKYAAPDGDYILIPNRTASILCKLLPDSGTVAIAHTDGKASFVSETVTVFCRLTDERFPQWQNVIPKNNSKALSFDRDTMIDTLNRVGVFSNKSTSLVQLDIAADRFEMSAEDIDFSNEAAEEFEGYEYSGEPLQIGFSAKLLSELLKSFPAGQITMTLEAAERPAIIEADGLLGLIMPVMLTSYQPTP